MKRNILSVLLACLMIVSLCLMVGCKTDDLEAQIIENDAKQEGAVSDAVADLESSIKSAADTAAADLAEAQKKLEGMIASGDAVDAAALDAAIAEFNTALAAAQEALGAAIDSVEGDLATVKADLEQAIKDATDAVAAAADKKLADAKAALEAAIADGDAALSTAIDDVTTALTTVQTILTDAMIAHDDIVKQELIAKYDAVIEEVCEEFASNLDYAVEYLEGLLEEHAELAAEELEEAVGALVEALDGVAAAAQLANDNLKTQLETKMAADIKTAGDQLIAYVDGKVADLQSKLDANATEDASVAELNKAVSDLNAAIAAAEAAAKAAAATANDALETALKAEIDADVKDAVDALTKYIDDEIKAVKDLLDANAAADAALSKKLSDEVTRIDNAIEAAKTLAADANDALKTELQKEIDDDVAALKTELTTYIDGKVKDLQDKLDANANEDASQTELADAVTALNNAITAVETAAANANDTLKTELQKEIDDDVAALKTELTTYIDGKVKDLQDKLDANANEDVSQTELSDAVTTLNNAIEAAKTVAANANDTLKAELQKEIDGDVKDAVDSLTAYIDAEILKLKNSTADDLKAAVDTINTNIADLKTLLQNADEDIKKDYNAKIDALNTKVDTIVNNWNNATDDAIDGVFAIIDAREEIITNYPTIAGVPAFERYVEEMKMRVIRAIDDAAVKALVDEFDATMDSAIEAVEYYDDIVFVMYYTDEKNAIDALYDAVLANLIKKGADAATLLDDFKEAVDKVKTKDEVIKAIFDTIGYTEADVVFGADPWGNALTKAETMIAAETDPIVIGNAAFIAVKNQVAKLRARYAVLGGYADGEALVERVDAILDYVAKNGIVYNDTTLEGLVSDFRTDYDVWYDTVYYGEKTNQIIAPELFGTKMTDFAAIEARIAALDKALADATTDSTGKNINARVDALIIAIDKYTVASANKIELEALTALVNAWKNDYFSGAYAAEAVDGNANYGLLDWADWNKLQADWADAQVKFKEIAGDYFNAVTKLPATIDLFSEDEITDALNAYDKMFGVTKYDNIFQEQFGKTAAEIQAGLAAKYTEYSNLKATALGAYQTAFAPVADYVNGTKKVDIYTNDAFANLLAWFDTYGCKVGGTLTFTNMKSDGTSITPAGYILSDTLTVTEADYNKFVELNKLAKDLVAAKTAETNAVKNAIAKIGTVVLADDPANDSNAAIKAAEDALAAWKAGTAAPDGITADQYKIDNSKPDYVVDDTDLVAARNKYTALVTEANAVKATIAALDAFTKSTDFADDLARDTYKAELNAAVAAINAFETNNAGKVGYVAFDLAKIDAGYLAIERYNNVVAIIAYENAMATGDAIVEDAKDEVLEQAILAIDSAAMDEVLDAYNLAVAKFKALYVDEYLLAYGAIVGPTNYQDYAEKALADAFEANATEVLAATTIAELPTVADDAFAAIEDIFAIAIVDAANVDGLVGTYTEIIDDIDAAMFDAFKAILDAIVADRSTYSANTTLATDKFNDFEVAATDFVAADAHVITEFADPALAEELAILQEILADELVLTFDAIAAAADSTASLKAKDACVAFNADVETAATTYVDAFDYVVLKASDMSISANATALAALERVLDEFADTVLTATDRVALVELLTERCKGVIAAVDAYVALYAGATAAQITKLDEQFNLDVEHTLFSTNFVDAATFATVIADNLERAKTGA